MVKLNDIDYCTSLFGVSAIVKLNAHRLLHFHKLSSITACAYSDMAEKARGDDLDSIEESCIDCRNT